MIAACFGSMAVGALPTGGAMGAADVSVGLDRAAAAALRNIWRRITPAWHGPLSVGSRWLGAAEDLAQKVDPGGGLPSAQVLAAVGVPLFAQRALDPVERPELGEDADQQDHDVEEPPLR